MQKGLYDLVKNSRSNSNAMEKLIDLFEPKVKKTLLMTNYYEREDLSQELKSILIQYILQYNVDSIPGFWDMKEMIESK